MRRMVFRCLILAVPFLAVSLPAADPPAAAVTVFQNARILPADGPPIDKGTLVVRAGKIVAVGPSNEVVVPAGAGVTVRDCTGLTIVPGLVDSHSHIGIYPRPHVSAHGDGNEMSGPVQSGLRALDSIWPDDPGLRMAVAGGVTTANIMPGSGNVIGGQTLYVKLRGRTIDAMRVEARGVFGGLKMANGENPKGYGRRSLAPFTRMKVAALQREQFVKARDYRRKWADHRKAVAEGKAATPPETDLALEPLVEVLDRKRTVHFHCHRADDLLTAVRLAEEFDFELVLQHATEGYRVADELVKRKIPVSLTLVDSPGGKPEVAGLLEENAAILAKAGIAVAINTDDFITESRFLLRTGSIAVRGGMTEQQALQALTINPAKMLHLDHRLGSLTKGKDADFAILSGSPFSVYTQVLETYIDGQRVYERKQPRDWAYQAGGFALPAERDLPKPPALLKPSAAVPVPAWEKPIPPAEGKPAPLVVLAGRVYTVSGGVFAPGAVVVEGGMVRSVAALDKFTMPAGAKVLTAACVTPGLIDAHTVVGLSGGLNVPADQDQDEHSDPNQADLRVLDGFNPEDGLLQFLRQNGVTVVHAVPGRVNVLAGQTGVFRTAGRTAAQMTLKFPAGVLVNLGEVPKSAYPNRLPLTRMGTANLLRTTLTQAQGYARQKAGDKPPARNLKLEALGPALEGKVPLVCSAHRADDIATALRIGAEFKLKTVLDLATEGYLMADQVAKAGVPVIVHPTMQRAGGSMETYHSHLCNAAVLADRKVPLAIGTGFEGYVPKTRVLRSEAAMAMVNGLGPERALRAVTLDAAKLLGVADQFGSIEPGKAADLVLYDGDPFEHATHVTRTIIAGKVVYDRAEYLKLPFARRALPLLEGGGVGCCMGAW